MKKELAIKGIFNDFKSKVILNDLEEEILIEYIKGETIVKISNDLAQSTSTVSRIIAELKEKYKSYKKLEMTKLMLFKKEK